MKGVETLTLIEEVIELERISKELEEIRKPNSEYIEKRTKEVFGNKKFYDREKFTAEISRILEAF